MREKGTSIVLIEREFMLLVHALVKAALYEFGNCNYIHFKEPEEVNDFVEQAISNVRSYAGAYSQMIRKLCRERAKHQGGIYREATNKFQLESLRLVQRGADDAIESMIQAARFKMGLDSSRLTCEDRAISPEDKPKAL